MGFDLLIAEREAAQSVIDLLALAEESKRLHERANMALPEPLKRVLGVANGNRKATPNVLPPERPPLPVGAGSDWVSIPAKNALPTSLALALMRAASGPLPVRELIEGVTEIRDDLNKGTIHNLGTRLESQKVISRSKDGWELLKVEVAPILDEGLIWGPANIFSKQELAVHRREALLHVLRTFRAGLQTSQIIEVLQNCPWVHAPVSKELVQDDVELLSKPPAKIKRRGNSKKWGLVEV